MGLFDQFNFDELPPKVIEILEELLIKNTGIKHVKDDYIFYVPGSINEDDENEGYTSFLDYLYKGLLERYNKPTKEQLDIIKQELFLKIICQN